MNRAAGIRFAIFALVLACLGEALGFPLMKAFALRVGLFTPAVSSWFMTAILLAGRFLVAALVLSFFERALPSKRELAQGFWIGIFAGGGHLLQADGLNWTDASTSAFLTQGYVVVLPFLAAIEMRKRPQRRVLRAVLVNLVGLAVLARFDPSTLTLGRGEAETLIAAVLFAGQIFSVSRPGYAQNRTGPVTMVMFLTVGLGAVPLAAAAAGPNDLLRLMGSLELWMLLGLLAVFCTLFPFLLMNRYQRFVSAAEAGVIYGAEPVLASAFALFLPAALSQIAAVRYENESLSIRLFVGAALVTCAGLLIRSNANNSLANGVHPPGISNPPLALDSSKAP